MMSLISTLSRAAAEAVNRTLALVGIALRFEFITPESAQDQLKQNPGRLQAHVAAGLDILAAHLIENRGFARPKIN